MECWQRRCRWQINNRLILAENLLRGKECYPAILTTGDIVKKAMSPDFDPEASAFFMATASGPCRFGQYNKFHRLVLDDLGFSNVPMYTMDQGENYGEDTKNLGTHFRKLAWNGIMYIDLLQKLQRETRPYELNKGEADAVYETFVKKAEVALEKRVSLVGPARGARDAFAKIKVDRSKPRPLIGVIGETYVRCNEFANNFLARSIERLGGEAFYSPSLNGLITLRIAAGNPVSLKRIIRAFLENLSLTLSSGTMPIN